MILVFGGTTEGRKTVEVLDEGGSPYYYSTKTGMQELTPHNGLCIDGAMDDVAMHAFCEEHQIRLIVDAAHPFASRLHQTIAEVAAGRNIPVVRYERIYPPRTEDITWIDDYSQVPRDIHTLLATTGVQSIARLKPLETEGIKVYYRILRRESSVALALQQGAREEQLCYYEDSKEIPVKADAILLKESGISGGFVEKTDEARRRGMRIIVLKRPVLHYEHSVNGPFGLRRTVEHLLPEFFALHSGLTTGTCATAAAIAATRQLLYGERCGEVPVLLPDGETISVPVGYGDGYAYCIKEAGDDPDVTNGIEVRASVAPSDSFGIHGGEGVGVFTLPGFDYPPGEPAINKGPREMMLRNIQHLTSHIPHQPSHIPHQPSTINHPTSHTPHLNITISVPGGEEIARRTFNPRLGIEGGISIIGVSGIVKPFSEEAFVNSIRKCMTVAKASGTDRVVINSGAKSERFLKARYPSLPAQAFVQYGNAIGETLKMAHELGIRQVTLGVMLGKAVKLAAGHLDTHSKKATMDLNFVRQLLREADCDIDIGNITLARELWERLEEVEAPEAGISRFVSTVITYCREYCTPLLPDGDLEILLIDDNGNIYEIH